MNYQQLPPPEYLKNYVQYFWVMESNASEASSKSFKTIADGCPGIIFQQPGKGVFYQYDKKLPEIFLFGQATRHAELILDGNFSSVGIYFFPHALKSVFGLDAVTLTDSCLDLNRDTGRQEFHLSERLAMASNADEKISILSSFLLKEIRRNQSKDEALIQFALSQIINADGNISLPMLLKQLHLSERNFERKFKQYIGMSPKLFARISRFRASLQQLRNNQYLKLSDIAFDNNYSDQSHFIRSFKEFAGFSPFQYQKQSNTIIENLTELAD